MALDPKLLEILRCPRTGQTLHPATSTELDSVRAAFDAGTLTDAGGATPDRAADALLITDNLEWAYAVDAGVPVMLPDQALAVRAVLGKRP
jgi:uncharacterized protein YbaR (Trm112 family)